MCAGETEVEASRKDVEDGLSLRAHQTKCLPTEVDTFSFVTNSTANQPSPEGLASLSGTLGCKTTHRVVLLTPRLRTHQETTQAGGIFCLEFKQRDSNPEISETPKLVLVS